MDFIQVYKCFCDPQRLRILNLLCEGPLCVCHIMEILDADQVKVSKQLSYMKRLGMVESERVAQWNIYRLSQADNALLQENLKCLQDCASEQLRFKEDLKKRASVLRQFRRESPECACQMEII